MVASDAEKRQALIDLLSLRDETDPRRGHHLTIEGRANRFEMLPPPQFSPLMRSPRMPSRRRSA